MRFERGASNTFTIPARPTTSPSNWLLRFVKVDGGLEVLCISDAFAVTGMPVQLTFTEVDSAPTATDGEVTLSLGQWHMYVYEQASASNLNYTLATRSPFDTLVEVVGAAVPDPPPTDPCSGGGGGGTVTITGTDGLTELPPVDCGDTYALPVTHIFFEDNVGQPSGVLDDLPTVVEEVDGHLYPYILVPSRYVKNSVGGNTNTFRATLEDLVNDTLPIAQDAEWVLKDTDGTELNRGFIPSFGTDDITAPDATVTRDGLPFGTVLSGGTIDVPSDCTPCDPTLDLSLNGGRVFAGLDLDCGLNSYDIAVTTEGGVPVGTYDNVDARIEVGPGVVQLEDTAANPIGSPVSVQPESGKTITAPDGSVTIRNSVPTTLHTVAVRSNGSTTQAIADSTITRPDGTTVGLPATVALDVRSYRSGIAYNFGRILHSGQTTVYQAGDEGTMYAGGFFTYVRPLYPTHYAELGANFTTLAANNIYGNTLRFTDRTGAAAASSGNRFIQDHLTGIEYYVLGTYLTAATWNAAVTAGVNINTTLGETGWYLPNDRVLDTITNDDSAAFISGAPFSAPTSNNLWTSSTVPGGTTGAKFLGLQFGQLGSIAKTTAGQLYGIFCRRFI